MYLPILNTSPQSFCTYLFSTYYTKCTLTFCLHFVFQTYFYVDISYKKVLKGPDAAPFAVCQFNSHYHLEEEEPLWFYDLAYFVIVHTEILFFPHFSGVWWVTQVLWIWYSHWMSSWAARQSCYFCLTALMCKKQKIHTLIPWGVFLVDRCYMNTYLNFEP